MPKKASREKLQEENQDDIPRGSSHGFPATFERAPAVHCGSYPLVRLTRRPDHPSLGLAGGLSPSSVPTTGTLGPATLLFEGLATTGGIAIEGVCGPPQRDTLLLRTRRTAGAGIVLGSGMSRDIPSTRTAGSSSRRRSSVSARRRKAASK